MNCKKLINPSMDKKKKQLKHTVNKAKEQSSMEKRNQNDKSKTIHDILPLDLIHRILLLVPIRHLARLRCVSKLWYSLISEPDFAELHFHHSPAATNACFFMKNYTMAYLVYLDDNDASKKVVCPPFKKKPPSDFEVLGSCRGFILLHRYPHFLVVWNPLTGVSKRISYSHIVSRPKYHSFRLPYSTHLHGFGYDASQDDYLVVAACRDYERQEDHLECLSLRTNSWINLDAVLPSPLDWFDHNSCGLFLNGAIHWVPSFLKDYRDAILCFDLKERTFSRISAPEQLLIIACPFRRLALLGDCLSLYGHNYSSGTTEIWVMKEYKVHSSWTLYEIPCKIFQPLCLSSNGDIIGRGYDKIGYFIYNVRGDMLKRFKNLPCPPPIRYCVYRESLAVLPLPSGIKDKDKKKKENCHQVHHQV
ncbi:F-box protein CPR30-like [Arachis ipaensis]|uniref:F-box domain-containing protein n=1 Tax=Arachis hypogaea TaxID=3818 RepID=A0A445CA51_ARAHY|nr:F-box protein CPR30-like [Arachis ipaensis]XP_025668405.1 F-box protein CPR1 [Arachis hypogaea]QHN93941.1 F-box protein [Arachis hypogaea]QHN93942.1 F-box protein [Arachis hypogaea]RYR47818.1 hypothetical protein Ahy_A07g033783 [Arachis hypogaea]